MFPVYRLWVRGSILLAARSFFSLVSVRFRNPTYFLLDRPFSLRPLFFARSLPQVYIKRGNLLYLTPRPEAKATLAAREQEVGESLARMQAIAEPAEPAV